MLHLLPLQGLIAAAGTQGASVLPCSSFIPLWHPPNLKLSKVMDAFPNRHRCGKLTRPLAMGIQGRFSTNATAFIKSPWKCAVLLAIAFYISVVLGHAVWLQGLTDKSCKVNTVTHYNENTKGCSGRFHPASHFMDYIAYSFSVFQFKQQQASKLSINAKHKH